MIKGLGLNDTIKIKIAITPTIILVGLSLRLSDTFGWYTPKNLASIKE